MHVLQYVPIESCKRVLKFLFRFKPFDIHKFFWKLTVNLKKVFKTKNKGWGLRTLEPIPKGSFVGEYLGEIISAEEAERRGQIYDAQKQSYLFDLDLEDKENCLRFEKRRTI